MQEKYCVVRASKLHLNEKYTHSASSIYAYVCVVLGGLAVHVRSFSPYAGLSLADKRVRRAFTAIDKNTTT